MRGYARGDVSPLQFGDQARAVRYWCNGLEVGWRETRGLPMYDPAGERPPPKGSVFYLTHPQLSPGLGKALD